MPSRSDDVHPQKLLSDEEVVTLLNHAQALVMPSVNEGFGLGAVEAAACQTPVIATRNSPLPRLLAGGGYFIDPHQPADLQDALQQLLADPARQQQLGQVAYQQAQKLTWSAAADQFRALLTHLQQER